MKGSLQGHDWVENGQFSITVSVKKRTGYVIFLQCLSVRKNTGVNGVLGLSPSTVSHCCRSLNAPLSALCGGILVT